ncbi:MAG: Ferredoxin-dependent glutamate synthase 1, partial [Planctomycetota bacterium]
MTGLPPAQGLYDPAFEHDACGVGFIANLKGKKTHQTVARGVQILRNLTHRGAVGADPLDGDGAGILIQIPDAFFRAVAGTTLPIAGDYAVGMVFLPKAAAVRSLCEKALESALTDYDLDVLGWRDVPVDSSTLGRNAKASEPAIRQVFVGRGKVAAKRFESVLYLARKRAEKRIAAHPDAAAKDFYVCSLSAKTIVYKGMLLSEGVDTYFKDLSDERCTSAIALVHSRYSTNTFPTWSLAHPFRLTAHNGEINTLRGNVNRMKAREALFAHPELGDAVEDLKPVIIEGGSDTACFDNALEFLTRTGRSLPHALAMMVPEAWATKAGMKRDLKGFYEYHATMMEPWDGPANLVTC